MREGGREERKWGEVRDMHLRGEDRYMMLEGLYIITVG
jgi:hypothetical protein